MRNSSLWFIYCISVQILSLLCFRRILFLNQQYCTFFGITCHKDLKCMIIFIYFFDIFIYFFEYMYLFLYFYTLYQWKEECIHDMQLILEMYYSEIIRECFFKIRDTTPSVFFLLMILIKTPFTYQVDTCNMIESYSFSFFLCQNLKSLFTQNKNFSVYRRIVWYVHV